MALEDQLKKLNEHLENCTGILQIQKKYLEQTRTNPHAFTATFPSKKLKNPAEIEALKSKLTNELTEALILKLWAGFEKILFDLLTNARGEISKRVRTMDSKDLSTYYRQM